MGRVHGAELWSVEVTSVDTPDQVTWKSAAKRVKLPWLSRDIYHGMCFRRVELLGIKFKGKEHLLLEKMTQRYESDGGSAGADESGMTRSELAAKRHADRMRKLRENK